MKRNMTQWLQETLAVPQKKAMPILSFPGTQIIGATVLDLVQNSTYMANCMKAIADRYNTGISVSLMDLSVEAEAFGCQVHFSQNEIPTIHNPLVTTLEEAEVLVVPEVGAGRTGICVEGIRLATEKITDRPVFAGIIGPYSLAGRLIGMTDIMINCYEEPEMVEMVLRKATDFLITYAKAFKAAGANGIVMAEPAAGLLSPSLLEEFSTPYVQEILKAVEDDSFLVIYHNCGNITPLLSKIKEIGAKAYSFGNAIALEDALAVMPSNCMIMGNLDPAGVIKGGMPDTVKADTLALLNSCSKYGNFIPASGCDIPPDAPLENIAAFMDAVDGFYAGVKTRVLHFNNF